MFCDKNFRGEIKNKNLGLKESVIKVFSRRLNIKCTVIFREYILLDFILFLLCVLKICLCAIINVEMSCQSSGKVKGHFDKKQGD